MSAFKKVIFVFSAFVMLQQPLATSAQNLSPKQHKKLAIKSQRYNNVYAAIEHYKAYLESKTAMKGKDVYYAYTLAELYRSINDYENAMTWYKVVYSYNKNEYPQALFYYAQMLKMTGNYEASTDNLNTFKRIKKSKKDKALYRKPVKNALLGNELAKSLIDSPLNVSIQRLGTDINRKHIELSPLFVNDTLMYYASLPSNKILVFDKSDSLVYPVTRFYEAAYSDSVWYYTKEVPYNFNQMEGNLGNAVFSADKNRLYYTQCLRDDKGKLICSLWYVQKTMGIWDDPVKLPATVNSKKYTTTQPAIGIDPKKGYELIYFVSDRPGGRGGNDIWYTIFDERKQHYTAPKNAGGKINTAGDEITPFYDLSNRRLYFSSNYYPGLGGYDVYKSFGAGKKWEKPINVGYPINSSADDQYYVLNPNDLSKGFLTSNRTGTEPLTGKGCCDDIFYFEYLDYLNLGIRGYVYELMNKDSLQYIEDILSEGNAADSLQRICLTGVQIDLFLVDSTEEILLKEYISDTNCTYFFNLEQGNNYKIVASKKGYFSKQSSFTTVGRYLSDTLTRHLKLSPIPKKPIIVKNIYYPFDEFYLTDSAREIIDTTIYRLMLENPTIIAEISSHTDSKGSDYYNFNLSNKRAQSVVDYLIEKGIEKKRLIAKGYGETQPIAENNNPDGTDNPVGRQKNRRTEFKVVGELQHYSEVIYEE